MHGVTTAVTAFSVLFCANVVGGGAWIMAGAMTVFVTFARAAMYAAE